MRGWAKLSLSNHQIKTDHNPRPQLSAVIVLQSAVAKALQLVTNLKVLRMGESFPPFAGTAGLTFAFADIYSNFESFLWNHRLLLNHFMNDEKNEVHFFPVASIPKKFTTLITFFCNRVMQQEYSGERW